VLAVEAIGVRDPVGSKPVTPDTMFYIASATKPYVASVIMQLAAAGKIDLDAPVKRYLPRFQIADPELTEKLTVRDLLTHRQGLNTFPIVFLDAFTGEITEDRYYHFLKTLVPQKKVAYSNIHFTLAGRVIQAVDGKPWREALKERLFAPSGMTRTTGYADAMYADPDVAVPQNVEGDRWVAAPRKSDRTMHAAGGLGTSARDLARWLRLNLNGGRIEGKESLPRAALEQMFQVQVKAPEGRPDAPMRMDGYGLAWQVGVYHGRRLVTHGGGYTGAASRVSFLPDEKIGVAIVSNFSGPAGRLCDIVCMDVFNRLLNLKAPDEMPRLYARHEQVLADTAKAAAARLPPPVDAKVLSLAPAAYAGTYASEHWGTLRIAVKDGKLTASFGDLPVPLRTAGTDRFEIEVQPRTWRKARFEVNGGLARSVVVSWNDHGDARFDRRRP
jgi:CubicO group peptidase (beta-lactamase class C family)